MAKDTKASKLPGAKQTVAKPSYVPTEAWLEMSNEQQAFAADPANEAAVKEAYEPDETDTAVPDSAGDVGETISVAISDETIPVSFRNQTSELAGKISDQDREAFVEAVDMEMQAKARSVALYAIIVRAYGEGAASLPRRNTTAKDANLFDLFEYRKKNSKGKFQKKPSEGSVLEITAYKAMISAGLHSRIKELEKRINELGKGVVPPFGWSTELDTLRDKRNKLIKKFVFAVRLVHVLAEIGAMDRVGWSFIASDGSTDINDDMSNLHLSNNCVLLFAKNADGSRGGMQLALSPGEIVEYRPSWALENVSKFDSALDALLASQDPGTPEVPEGESDVEIESFDTLDRTLAGAYAFLKKFAGPSASKTDINSFKTRLMSDAGARTLSLVFDLVEMLEEAVTSKDDYKSKNGNNKTRISREMGEGNKAAA